MSLARLSAGAGYKYLLKHTACGDACREAGTSLTSYYAASGYPAGRWFGRGLTGLDGGHGVPVGTTVTEEPMGRLFGAGRDPVTDGRLGRPYPEFKTVDERVAAATAKLPGILSTEDRATAVADIERREKARPVRAAVAGFDLTFTAPKSASVLWALGDPATQQAIVDAHRTAVTGVLELIEDRYLHTRVGTRSCAQVKTRGMIAAAFDHWDTRSGDPNLHTHVVIANKVQGPDGGWRSVDGQALYAAAVALSEVYDDVFADEIAARLPVTWGSRPRGERRNPAFEIDGVPDNLLAAFSGRATQIEAHLRGLLEAFTSEHGRAPTRREVLRLRQQATLATRPDKEVLPLRDLIACWRDTATTVTGQDPEQIVERTRRRGFRQRLAAGQVPPEVIDALADATVAAASARRSTWTRPNLVAEAARASRPIRMRQTSERIALVDRVVDAATARCVALDPPDLFATPTRFRRPDATSAFTRPDEHAFTTREVLDAEARLLAATRTEDATRIPTEATEQLTRPQLSPDQRAAVAAIAASGRRVDVLVGPAGTGKTRTLYALRLAWEAEHGSGSVIGLAPSSTAAGELSTSLGVACENTAKWLHDLTTETTDPATAQAFRPRRLVIVDEASMVSTQDLDAIVTHASGSGAKVVLVGDHQQLGAVGAGGAFALLADTTTAEGTAAILTGLWRFQHRWEAEATRNLRAGKPAALDAYDRNGRLHDGPAETMLDAAYLAWAADLAAGRSTLLLAADRRTVSALNTRAHDDRVEAGLVSEDGIRIADDAIAGRGDVVVTRRNERRIGLSDGGYVRNGALWQITDAQPDGSLDLTPLTGPDPSQRANATVRVPADYVREHVELGYAATVHRAQGMTVEHGHVLVTPPMTRQSLYVAMTRGRAANHAYVATDAVDPTCLVPPDVGPTPTGRQILDKVLATDGAELSATAEMRRRQDQSASFDRLLPIRDTLTAAAEHGDPECTDAARDVTHLLRLRALALRQSPRSTPSRFRSASTPNRPEGIHR